LTFEKVPWRIILFGAAATSILLYFGTWLLGLYISNYAGASVGGALGSVLLLLLWVYYEAQMVLIGSQFIKTLYENSSKLPKILKTKS
jgi:membrane protein